MDAGGRVKFDFEGSLELARQLWALAADVETADAGRQTDFDVAKAKWSGAYGDEFVTRRDAELSSRVNVASGLRRDANAWAAAWATALEQQNKNNRAAEVERIRDSRSGLEQFGDFFAGDDSDEQVPAVKPVATPTGPAFLPTATEKRY